MRSATSPSQLVLLSQGQTKQIFDSLNTNVTHSTRPQVPVHGQFLQLAQADGTISASTDGQLTSGTAQLVSFSNASSPATLSATGLTTVTVWNPHEDAIPDNTYLILGRIIGGWIIIAPLNYCP